MSNMLRINGLGLVMGGGVALALLGVLAMAYPSDELAPASEARPKYAPGVLIVKFKEPVADQLKAALVRGEPLHEVSLTPSLDALNAKYGLTDIRMLFPSFQVKDADGRITRIETPWEHATRVTRAFPVRSARAVAGRPVPDLSRVFELAVADGDMEAAASEYALSSDVGWAHADYYAELAWVPNDPYYHSSGSWGQYFDDLWGIKTIRCSEAWDLSRGSGVIIAVVDTGIWYRAVQNFHPHWEGHPDIRPNLWYNYAEYYGSQFADDDQNGYTDDIWGWDFVYWHDGRDPIDGDMDGHGTHVAGTAAAVGNNSFGVIGVAPQARVMNVKCYEGAWAPASDNAAAVMYAADNGADVLNLSWGVPYSWGQEYTGVIEEAVQYAYAHGAVVVACAHNYNANCNLYCPAGMKETITVAATKSDDQRAPYSNWGVLIDVAAPGGDQEYAAGAPGGKLPSLLSLRHSSNYVNQWHVVGTDQPPVFRLMDGTSMATPHVVGVAALILSVRPTINAEALRQCIRKSAVDLGSPGFDELYGHGRLDAKAAVDRALGGYACQALIWAPKDGSVFTVGQGQTIEILGLADGNYLQQWTVHYRRKDAPYQWTVVATGYQARNAQNGYEMGSVEVDDLAPGEYLLKLSVYGYYMWGYYDYVSIIVSSP